MEKYVLEETFICANCGEEYPTEAHGESELALTDNICIYCMMEDDYGR